jgi:hypothetical protein
MVATARTPLLQLLEHAILLLLLLLLHSCSSWRAGPLQLLRLPLPPPPLLLRTVQDDAEQVAVVVPALAAGTQRRLRLCVQVAEVQLLQAHTHMCIV